MGTHVGAVASLREGFKNPLIAGPLSKAWHKFELTSAPHVINVVG